MAGHLRTIRSPRFWNFFLNSDFRSSERLGNRIKFGELESNSRFWLVTCAPSDRRDSGISS
ncbi:hypothetical protein L835_4115 [Mycobacteroides abscessus MAB_110811_1470]|nr:hypothetical protein L835_4115 [Mycobacteroides abscessus MAB_110811_1470]